MTGQLTSLTCWGTILPPTHLRLCLFHCNTRSASDSGHPRTLQEVWDFVSCLKEVSQSVYTCSKSVYKCLNSECMGQQPIKQEYGIIQTPSFNRVSTRLPFKCSWIINVPCTNGVCALTIYFDALNITNADLITVRQNYSRQ